MYLCPSQLPKAGVMIGSNWLASRNLVSFAWVNVRGATSEKTPFVVEGVNVGDGGCYWVFQWIPGTCLWANSLTKKHKPNRYSFCKTYLKNCTMIGQRISWKAKLLLRFITKSRGVLHVTAACVSAHETCCYPSKHSCWMCLFPINGRECSTHSPCQHIPPRTPL